MNDISNSAPVSFSIEDLESILKLSQMYSCDDGIHYAHRRLQDQKDNILPARLLNMAIKHRFSDFFQHAFRALAFVPSHSLSVAELELIPPSVLCKLLAVRHSVNVHRQSLALNKLPIYLDDLHSAGCERGCVNKMKNRWDTVAIPMLLSSECHSAEAINKVMADALDEDHTCAGCTVLYKGSYIFNLVTGEHLIIDQASREAWDSESGRLVEGEQL